MKSKKVVLLIILVVGLIATIGICYATDGTTGEIVQELRLIFNKKGDLLRVEPINERKYEKVEYIENLYGQKVGTGMSVMFGSESPVCTYWWTYKTTGGYTKVCLKWE